MGRLEMACLQLEKEVVLVELRRKEIILLVKRVTLEYFQCGWCPGRKNKNEACFGGIWQEIVRKED